MKEQTKIPTSKVERASRFIKTGAKIGGNYIKHYAKKAINGEANHQELHENNANDIYDSLSELKGSALKVLQMLSLDKNLLPTAYQDRFAMAQYSAPPLSYPLVVKTFRAYFGTSPDQVFESFTSKAMNAASIGQVHQAVLEGKKLAVKVQYPGVAKSVTSDLKLVKPIALRMFKLNEKELDQYLEEVESKLLEETDYELELERSMAISKACRHLTDLVFPEYYADYSARRVLTMDWLDGQHLKEFIATDPPQESRDRIGQALWDFYHHQVHNLKQVHADPHPGNFIIQDDGRLGVIDFGCVKEIPEDFYYGYFKMINKDLLMKEEELIKAFYELKFIYESDGETLRKLYIETFREMIGLLGRPFHHHEFDFADDAFFKEIYNLSERISETKEFKNSKNARGSRHALYINRTYFGLYNLLNELKAKVKTTKPEWFTPQELMV